MEKMTHFSSLIFAVSALIDDVKLYKNLSSMADHNKSGIAKNPCGIGTMGPPRTESRDATDSKSASPL